jgi:hypothetical protein
VSTDLRDIAGGHFRDADRDWFPDERADAGEVAEAWVQFNAAKLVWRALADGTATRDDVAALTKQSWESQRRKLSGEQPASLSDVARWVFAFDSEKSMGWLVDSLLPPAYRRLLSGWEQGRGELPRFRSRLAWSDIAAELAQKLAPTLARPTTALLTDEVLLWLTGEEMSRAGAPSSRVRIAMTPTQASDRDERSTVAMPEAPAIEYGPVGSSSLIFAAWFDAEAGRDSARAAHAVLRAKHHLWRAALASARERPATLVVAAPGETIRMLLDALTGMSEEQAAWGSRKTRSEWSLGPFRSDVADGVPSSNDADQVSAWWSHHSCPVHPLADAETTNARVIVLGVGKPAYV